MCGFSGWIEACRRMDGDEEEEDAVHIAGSLMILILYTRR